MICSNCGRTIRDGSILCYKCGELTDSSLSMLRVRISSTSFVLRSTETSSQADKKCLQCGATIYVGDGSFCTSCEIKSKYGHRLSPAVPLATTFNKQCRLCTKTYVGAGEYCPSCELEYKYISAQLNNRSSRLPDYELPFDQAVLPPVRTSGKHGYDYPLPPVLDWPLDAETKVRNLFYKISEAVDADNVLEALKLCNEALALKTLPGEVYLIQGEVFTIIHRYQEAIEAYDKAYKQGGSPTSLINVPSKALMLKGAALNALRKFEEAITILDQAVALDPGDPEHYMHKAHALEKLGRNDEARELRSEMEALLASPEHAKLKRILEGKPADTTKTKKRK